jgi:hypothetical protein
MRRRKPTGPKKVSYQLIPRESEYGKGMYRQLVTLVNDHHEDLREARIVLAWCLSWKADIDGHVTIGICRKASDLDRELIPYDLIILLSRTFWQSLDVTDEQRTALLDHELCHATVKIDKTGEPMVDERGRKVFRIRKHDLEEFAAIVERHGLYKRDLEQFAAALRRSALVGFKPCEACQDTPSWIETSEGLKRCSCWRAWQAQLAEAQPQAKSA